ncbi:olfactory receptor 10G6-like [Tiliqua scincoides]|uniref:olfactory receptor 10G6-like n=1 Tax=Tiliqua scincoides TaxID=71010 RepID=UPI00346332FA
MLSSALTECENLTSSFENFELLGFQYPPNLKFLLLFFFFLMLLLSLSGNGLIFFAVALEPQLHKPMYWFLCHLAVVDMVLSSVIVPKLIAWLIEGNGVISFTGCVSQLFLFHCLGCTECLLYTVMAFDRFLAICRPLHYSTVMNHRVCVCLSFGAWFGGSLHSVIETSITFRLPYGRGTLVNYIFCDIPAVLKLACADTSLNELLILVDVELVAITCFLLILTSYVYIIIAILRIPTAKGRHRAFSTCTAHITLVVIYYVPVVYSYLRPPSQDSLDGVVAMFYTAVTPCLNPLIYTLRNKEMKIGLQRLWSRKPPQSLTN